MSVTSKYQSLLDQARAAGVRDLSAQEQNGVLYVTGTAATPAIKQQLWDTYNRLDPDMRAADAVLNIEVAGGDEAVYYTVEKGDSLSKIAQHYPGVTWQQIFEANRDQVKDANLIQVGQKLRIPR